MNTELYHWKYVKREKKGDKWVYTYDNPNKYSKTTRDTNKLFSKKYKLSDGKGTEHVYNRRGKIERYIDGIKRDIGESKQRVSDIAKNSNGEIVDTDKWHSTNTTVTFGGGMTYKWHNRGKRERLVDTAKEYVKDRLGFDEKEKMTEAKTKLDDATDKRNTAIRSEVSSQASKNLGKAVGDRVKTEQAREKAVINNRDYSHAAEEFPFGLQKIDAAARAVAESVRAQYHYDKLNKLDTETIPQLKKELEPYKEKSSAAIKEYIKATEEYVNAQEEYFRTPLGKLDKTKKSIESARDYVSELFNRKRKK